MSVEVHGSESSLGFPLISHVILGKLLNLSRIFSQRVQGWGPEILPGGAAAQAESLRGWGQGYLDNY